MYQHRKQNLGKRELLTAEMSVLGKKHCALPVIVVSSLGGRGGRNEGNRASATFLAFYLTPLFTTLSTCGFTNRRKTETVSSTCMRLFLCHGCDERCWDPRWAGERKGKLELTSGDTKCLWHSRGSRVWGQRANTWA